MFLKACTVQGPCLGRACRDRVANKSVCSRGGNTLAFLGPSWSETSDRCGPCVLIACRLLQNCSILFKVYLPQQFSAIAHACWRCRSGIATTCIASWPPIATQQTLLAPHGPRRWQGTPVPPAAPRNTRSSSLQRPGSPSHGGRCSSVLYISSSSTLQPHFATDKAGRGAICREDNQL